MRENIILFEIQIQHLVDGLDRLHGDLASGVSANPVGVGPVLFCGKAKCDLTFKQNDSVSLELNFVQSSFLMHNFERQS